MFEGEVGGKNINQLALMQGLAVPNPFTKQLPFVMHHQGMKISDSVCFYTIWFHEKIIHNLTGFGPRPPPPMPHPHHHEWDKDYLEYGGSGRLGQVRGPHHPNQAMMNPRPLRRPGQMDNQG